MQRFILSFACLLAAAGLLFAADVSGKWTASFETQIGVQNYTYDFKVARREAHRHREVEFRRRPIVEGTVKGDQIDFVENLNMEGQQIRIVYTGKISGDEIKFTRKVGDFADEPLVAKRAK